MHTLGVLALTTLAVSSESSRRGKAQGDKIGGNCPSEPIPQVQEPWQPVSNGREAVAVDLHREYGNIFKHGNRNAASHLWSSFLLRRSEQISTDNLIELFTAFCAISGSPVRPVDYNRYAVRLPLVPNYRHCPEPSNARRVFGYMHHCCWPCVCDNKDFVHVDTKTVVTKDSGPAGKQFHFAVIGDPCKDEGALSKPWVSVFDGHKTSLQDSAPEVRCTGESTKELEGAVLSDHGYIIIGMIFESELLEPDAEIESIVANGPARAEPGAIVKHPVTERLYQDVNAYRVMCHNRAEHGYDSGMGVIFRKVAEITSIAEPRASPTPRPTSSPMTGAPTTEPASSTPSQTPTAYPTNYPTDRAIDEQLNTKPSHASVVSNKPVAVKSSAAADKPALGNDDADKGASSTWAVAAAIASGLGCLTISMAVGMLLASRRNAAKRRSEVVEQLGVSVSDLPLTLDDSQAGEGEVPLKSDDAHANQTPKGTPSDSELAPA